MIEGLVLRSMNVHWTQTIVNRNAPILMEDSDAVAMKDFLLTQTREAVQVCQISLVKHEFMGISNLLQMLMNVLLTPVDVVKSVLTLMDHFAVTVMVGMNFSMMEERVGIEMSVQQTSMAASTYV